MSLSEKRKEELKKAATNALDEINFLDKEGGTRVVNTAWYIFLAYLSSENLVKHSKSLTRWTIVIAITTLALILFTITQIVLEFI